MSELTEFQKHVPQMPDHLDAIFKDGREPTIEQEKEIGEFLKRAMEIGRPIALQGVGTKTGRPKAWEGGQFIPRGMMRRGRGLRDS